MLFGYGCCLLLVIILLDWLFNCCFGMFGILLYCLRCVFVDDVLTLLLHWFAFYFKLLGCLNVLGLDI